MLRKMLGPNGFWPADAMAAKVRQQIAQISAVRVKGRRGQGGLDPQVRQELIQRLSEGDSHVGDTHAGLSTEPHSERHIPRHRAQGSV